MGPRLVMLLAMIAAACGDEPRAAREIPVASPRHRATQRPPTPAPVVVAQRSHWSANLIADSTGLYWSETAADGADVWYLPIPTDGQSPRSVWHVDGTFRALALDAEMLYAVVAPKRGLASVVRRGKMGGTVTTIATELWPDELVVSDGAVYATGSGQIFKLAIDGPRPPARLAMVDSPLYQFAVGERHVVFSYLPDGAKVPRLARVAKTGGDIEILVGELRGGWTLYGTTLYVSLDNDRLVKIGPDDARQIAIGGDGTPLGVSGDKLLVSTGVGDTVQVRSLASGVLSAPVDLGRRRSEMRFSDGALWYLRRGRDPDGHDLNDLMMFVP